MSLVPAKQFAPVVVLKAGLVRFPMLSPPSDSTYWGHLRKNVPGQCRKRAEFVGHFWWEIPGSESILGFLTTSEEDSDSKLGKIRAMACGSDTVGCRPWGDLGSLRESYCNWHKKPKPEKVTKVIDGYLWIFMEFYGYLWIFIWILKNSKKCPCFSDGQNPKKRQSQAQSLKMKVSWEAPRCTKLTAANPLEMNHGDCQRQHGPRMTQDDPGGPRHMHRCIAQIWMKNLNYLLFM